MTERDDRIYPSQIEKSQDGRSPGRRDRDRILYSSAFRRLAGITQVISATDRFPIHNRLTHTLEVAQIGRSLAEQLLKRNDESIPSAGGLDPDVVEAACLAHDLGRPPFGHVAEEMLNNLVVAETADAEGFEGNDQVVRIVADFISSMTESQVIELHHRLTGVSLGAALDPIVP